MHFDLPDLKLVPQPEWKARRREWIALAEDCLYGHAPGVYACSGGGAETGKPLGRIGSVFPPGGVQRKTGFRGMVQSSV